jgi:hypothetical protein
VQTFGGFERRLKALLSLSKAEELKKAGLVWEPEKGDWYNLIVCGTGEIKGPNLVQVLPFGVFCNVVDIWLPSLSQLLAEIEAREWNWTIRKLNGDFQAAGGGKYRLVLLDKLEATWGIKNRQFLADTPEDAASMALIYLLKNL